MENKLSLERFKIDQDIPLEECHGWKRPARHIFDRKQAVAIMTAKLINRPLLVRGEPGCGKTQMARAAAQILQMPFACLVVNERTETEDVFYSFDALRRLSDANAPSEGVANVKKYLTAGPLWWALDCKSAGTLNGDHGIHPHLWKGTTSPECYKNGVVVLLDEIDKADRAIPNSLLEAMGNFSFPVPHIHKMVEWNESVQCAPLVIITTNEEQELPPAFIRRCVVFDIILPKEQEEFVAKIAQRGEALFRGKFKDAKIYREVAQMLWEKRKAAKSEGVRHLPGQAEYLDHLDAILAMKTYDPEKSEEKARDELAGYFYSKGSR
jgi:MoxR-like ATPase